LPRGEAFARPVRAIALATIGAGHFARRFARFDADAGFVLGPFACGALQRGAETLFHRLGHLEIGFGRADADRADLVAGDMATAAQQRQQPARIGVLAAADVHAEPGHIIETGAARGLAAFLGGEVDQVFGLRHGRAIAAHQRQRDVAHFHALHQRVGQGGIVFQHVVGIDRGEQLFQQALAVALADLGCAGAGIHSASIRARRSISSRRRRRG
jgi:hypothetical protein